MFILTAFTIRSNPRFETKTLFIRITCRFETFVQTKARPNQSLMFMRIFKKYSFKKYFNNTFRLNLLMFSSSNGQQQDCNILQ